MSGYDDFARAEAEQDAGKLIEFHVPTPRIRPNVTGKPLYDRYREERIRQGWEEFKWESLSEMQQLVWHRTAEAFA